MADYNVTITNGVGSQAMKVGDYNVSAQAAGYQATTLDPTTFTALDTTHTASFTLSADGTLTFIVNDTGAEGGTAITSGSIVMTDQSGNTQYGSPVNIDQNGNAVFANVPYGSQSTPYVLYFKQLSTDADHNIYVGVITANMTADSQTQYILNSALAVQTFNLTDANYSGLPISGTLNFTQS